MQSVKWCSRFLYFNNISPKLSKNLKVSNFFLRDNCQEDVSYNHVSHQRIHDTSTLDRNVQPLDVQLSPDKISITWSDKHKSNFNLSWFEKVFSRIKNEYELSESWNVEALKKRSFEVDYDGVMSSSSEKKKFYHSLMQNGFVLVRNAPRNPQSSMDLSREIGSIKDSREYFDPTIQYYTISNSNNHDDFDIAYTQCALPLHTDNPDMVHPGSLVTLQILEHTGKGGKSLLSDAMYSAEQLQKSDPEAFNILSTYRLVYQHITEGNNYIHAEPVIQLDKDTGKVNLVRVSESNRSAIQPFIKQEDMHKWYDAWLKFKEFFNHPDNVFERQLDFNTMLVFDNWRMLHARTSFTGDRSICGCYISPDTWKAKARKFNVF